MAWGKVDTGPEFYARGYGTYTYESSIPTTTESIWDVASLTKVLATTPAVMLLHDQGLLGLEDTVASHWPAFAQNGKGGVTIRQLLSHTAGLREWFPFFRLGKRNKAAIVAHICFEPLSYASGTPKYSDLGMIMLGCIVEKLAGVPLDTFVEERLFWPLGMTASRFRRVEELHWDRTIVPTSVDPGFRGRLLWGEVHDENAFLLGGVAGHAGLFSSASDIFRFVRMVSASRPGGLPPPPDDLSDRVRSRTAGPERRQVPGDRADLLPAGHAAPFHLRGRPVEGAARPRLGPALPVRSEEQRGEADGPQDVRPHGVHGLQPVDGPGDDEVRHRAHERRPST